MKLKIPHTDFSQSDIRVAFAKRLAMMISKPDMPFAPYMKNNSDSGWVLDAGNDWWLNFEEDDGKNIARITYRYQCEGVQAEQALAGWICFQYRGAVIIPS